MAVVAVGALAISNPALALEAAPFIIGGAAAIKNAGSQLILRGTDGFSFGRVGASSLAGFGTTVVAESLFGNPFAALVPGAAEGVNDVFSTPVLPSCSESGISKNFSFQCTIGFGVPAQ